MPRLLTDDEVDEFRREICRVAVELFVDRGYEAVTMRQIARRLGCSAMTPYRYFANKAEIFEAVRAECTGRFGAWVEEEVARTAGVGDPIEVLRGLGRAYVGFALAEPRAYRMMFEVTGDQAQQSMIAQDERAWELFLAAARRAVEAGAIDGDPLVLAHLLWAEMHGIVALHQSGRLQLGKSLDDLIEPALDLLLGAVA